MVYHTFSHYFSPSPCEITCSVKRSARNDEMTSYRAIKNEAVYCFHANVVPRVSSLLYLYFGIEEAVRQSDWLFTILRRNSVLRKIKIFLDKMACLGFSDSAILWFKSYLQDRSFSVNIGKEYSTPGNLSCGVPKGSILGPLIFLLYVNDMARAVDCDLLLYADDSCLIFRDTDIERIENNLNRNFNSLCDWFVENKLSIHFGEDKTKSILFGRKKCKILKKMNIRRGDIEIKQHSVVTYLGPVLDENLPGESMVTRMLGKINGKLKSMYRKHTFLDSSLRRLLLNAFIQPHFDYACSSWYPMLNKRLSKKIQSAQNKCIRFYLNLKNTVQVGATEFKAINWLPTKHRVDQNIYVNIMKFFNETAPAYADEIFHPANQNRITQRTKFRLTVPFRNLTKGQNYGTVSIRLNARSKKISLKIYKERKMTYMCTTDTVLYDSNP